MVKLLNERAEHAPAIDQLLDKAFGEARWHKTCQLLRDGRTPRPGLSLVAVTRNALVGTVRLWTIQAGRRRALLLGPLAVDPQWRDEGIGAALMQEALKRAAAAGEDAVLLVGDAPYYERFGFRSELTRGLTLPGPAEASRFMANELTPGAFMDAKGPLAPLAS